MSSKPRISTSYVHSIRQELLGVAVFVAVIWAVFLVTRFVPQEYRQYLGLIPRYVSRLQAVLTMPFMHRDVAHIASNTVPLFVLLTLLAGSRARSPVIVGWIVLLSGLSLWLIGRNGTPTAPITHIGASGLVFGLVTFHCAAGILERRPISILIAIAVGFLYGGMLFWNLLFPFLSTNDRVSWEGHLCGALAGVVVAFLWTRDEAKPLSDAIPAFQGMMRRASSAWKLFGPSVTADEKETTERR